MNPIFKIFSAAFPGILILCLAGGCGEKAADVGDDNASKTLNTALRVSVVSAAKASVLQETSISGVLEAFRKATVAAEVGGRLKQRLVEPGDVVAAKQVMLTLDEGKIRSAYAEAKSRVAVAKVNVASARSELTRGKNLAANAFISKDDLDALEFALQRSEAELAASRAAAATAARSLADTKVLAPFAGTAELVHVQEGDYVQPGMPAVTVADFSRLRIKAGVTAEEAAMLQVASKALVSFDTLGTAVLEGAIHSIGRIADAASGTYPMEVWLEQTESLALREGMVASIQLPQTDTTPQIAVPAVAVFRRAGRMHVFKVVDGVAALTPVRLGRRGSRSVEILAGVEEGDAVVVDGLFALRDGAPVIVRSDSGADTVSAKPAQEGGAQ